MFHGLYTWHKITESRWQWLARGARIVLGKQRQFSACAYIKKNKHTLNIPQNYASRYTCIICINIISRDNSRFLLILFCFLFLFQISTSNQYYWVECSTVYRLMSMHKMFHVRIIWNSMWLHWVWLTLASSSLANAFKRLPRSLLTQYKSWNRQIVF